MEDKNKRNFEKMTNHLGIKIIENVETFKDVYEKCDVFTMITNYSDKFKRKEEDRFEPLCRY